MKKLTFIMSVLLLLLWQRGIAQNGNLLPTSSGQNDFINTYKAVLKATNENYRHTATDMDSLLFPKFGEYSIYWITGDDADRGSFVYPQALPQAYNNVTTENYTNFDWESRSMYALQTKISPEKIAIFKSRVFHEKRSVNWEASYFTSIFDNYLSSDFYHLTDEPAILDSALLQGTELLMIPAFKVNKKDHKHFIDSIFNAYPQITARINEFLARGGMLYTEGNAAYFAEKLGYLQNGAVDYSNAIEVGSSGTTAIVVDDMQHPVGTAADATNSELYASGLPAVETGDANIIAKTNNDRATIFEFSGNAANQGRILINTGLPAVGGFSELNSGSRQLQWFLNTVFYAFSEPVDITRSVHNNIPVDVAATRNAISYNRRDTFDVQIIARNLSGDEQTGIQIQEHIHAYFQLVDVEGEQSFTLNGDTLVFSNVSIPAHSEKIIRYSLQTPSPDDKIHEQVDDFLTKDSYIVPSQNHTQYSTAKGHHAYINKHNYADIMFSARIMSDTDVNWKNFLGLEYQPFKVFTIMENKERTPAENTVYTQYIPKDVPFYWVNDTLDIPVLKTPGGKFVDVMRGSNDENNPQYDYDSDGNPDAWLDTSSIYPKGYTLEEDSVYWANPWAHLSGNDSALVYEDIDHDGKVARDTNNDGIVDVEEPGDKIRVWKVTWDIGRVEGYEYFDPYCSYEIWVDPPKLVELSAGAGYAHDSLDTEFPGMYYPNTPDIANANLNDTAWTHWMNRDKNDSIVWKQLVLQSINNYEGFTFVDTADYTLKPTDSLVGTVPQPNREFIAVLSMGGAEIDMFNPLPDSSLYSNLDYETIFNESHATPVRTTYTYYAPLPNPLQFEYMTNNYLITDTMNQDTLDLLPQYGKANLTFNIDAATEYTYYWIRNVGHDVDYNDPSQAIDGIEGLGDGVFGYMLYEIPKGFAGYSIDLPRKDDGSFMIDSIVSVDGKPFEKWIDNENTANSIEISETPFVYEIYIPQVLIPAALDDDNFDGIDDWIDDRGDRFSSETGFHHDAYMPGNGEDYTEYPEEPFKDDIYGMVDSGWFAGADETYGDDFFETLGKTNIKINAIYEGKGKEGSIDISKGGTLVVEEIFGGSPWVIFSHTLSGYAEGVNYALESAANPSLVKYPNDTIYIKHRIYDKNEPHLFDADFSPHHISFGAGEATATSYAGGRDPAGLITPNTPMANILDPDVDHQTLTLLPMASESDNPKLDDYPRDVSGTFFEARVEVMNGTDDDWLNATVKPQIPDDLGNTSVEMAYVAYPRPLVPGDNLGTLEAGWRFNQPEGEVLIDLGDTLSLLQPSRRAYFVFLFKVDESLDKGVYEINFTMDGKKQYYDGTINGRANYSVPPVWFSLADKSENGNILEYEKTVLGKGALNSLQTLGTSRYNSLKDARWSMQDVDHSDFNNLGKTLPVSTDAATNKETIDLSRFSNFPGVDTSAFFVLSQGKVNTYNAPEVVSVTEQQQLHFELPKLGEYYITEDSLNVSPIGPKLVISKFIASINGEPLQAAMPLPQDTTLFIDVKIEVKNEGVDVSSNTVLDFLPESGYEVLKDSLPEFVSLADNLITADLGSILPGQIKSFPVNYRIPNDSASTELIYTIIETLNMAYEGTAYPAKFEIRDTASLNAAMYDFDLSSFAHTEVVNKQTRITVKAINRGMPAKDVWLRIYPLIDSLAYDEIPLAETKISHYTPGQEVTLQTSYQLPTSEQVRVLARIDDGDDYYEVFENNNTMELTLLDATNIHQVSPEYLDVSITPNPMRENAWLHYNLPNAMKQVDFKLYTASGKLVKHLGNCPVNQGKHKVKLNINNISGQQTLVYKLNFKDEHGIVRRIQSKIIHLKK